MFAPLNPHSSDFGDISAPYPLFFPRFLHQLIMQPLNLRRRHLQKRHLQVVSMCSCPTWCMIARRVSKPNICGLLMLHCLWEHGCEPEISCFKHFLVFACLGECGQRLRCTHAMRALTCVSVVVCVARKLRLCLSNSRRRDRINLGLLRSYDKGGRGYGQTSASSGPGW